MLVMWWDADGVPICKLYTGEWCGRDAKRHVAALLPTISTPIRVFALIDVFQVVGASQRMLPDQWAPVLDLMLREQAMGKGFQAQRRGPPRQHPEAYMAAVGEAALDNAPPPMGYTHDPVGGLQMPAAAATPGAPAQVGFGFAQEPPKISPPRSRGE